MSVDGPVGQRLKLKKTKIIVSEHALLRFKERWIPLDDFDPTPSSNEEWLDKIETLFRGSNERSLDRIGRIKQLIDYGSEKIRFFRNRNYGYEFRVVEQSGCLLIKTIIHIGLEYQSHLEDVD